MATEPTSDPREDAAPDDAEALDAAWAVFAAEFDPPLHLMSSEYDALTVACRAYHAARVAAVPRPSPRGSEPSMEALVAAIYAHHDEARRTMPHDPEAVYTINGPGLMAALKAAYAVDFPPPAPTEDQG